MSDLSGFSMMELFREEVEVHSVALSEGLLELEQEGSTEIEPLMRAAHSLKGAARIVDLEAVVTIAHVMEDCFVASQEGTVEDLSSSADTLLRGVDLIVRISKLEESELPDWMESSAYEIDTLTAELRSIASAEAPAPVIEKASQRAAAEELTPEDDGGLGGFSMLELFREEVETHGAALNEGLLELENDGATDFEALMRAAHSIKGAARIVDLDGVVQLAHALEDCFVAAQKGLLETAEDNTEIFLRSVDLMAQLAALGEGEVAPWLIAHADRMQGTLDALRSIATRKAETSAEKKPEIKDGKETRKTVARDLRIRAESLTRLMGLAGESVVAAGWLEPFTDSLVELKRSQNDLGDRLEAVTEALREGRPPSEELSSAKEALQDSQRILGERLQQLESYSRRSTDLSSRLYREVLSGRMRPFNDGVKAFPRMVRDVARDLGKKVRLVIAGKETEVDRDILDQLEAPLNHILRNAVDHGLETTEERAGIGKETMGTIRLEARHQGGKLAVTVSDDGRGIDLARVRKRVLERQLAPEELVAEMSKEEILGFMFLPGFSTASSVTEISGRGVGLDVVQSMVQDVGGAVHVESDLGRGTTFILRLPVTRSVIRILLVEIADEPFALPLASADRILKVLRSQIGVLEDRQFFDLDGENVGLVAARQVLGLNSAPSNEEVVSVVILGSYQERYGIVVDRFLGEREVVVQSLDERLGKVSDIAAAALMEDGSPVLILDAEDIVRSINALLAGERLARVTETDAAVCKRVLVVDDSVTMREVERRLLENEGYLVDVAVDGADGWNALRSGQYDLVISDVDMPRMNGFELVRKLRSEARLKQLPVIMISYKDREEDRKKGMEVGANAYLTKANLHDRTVLDSVRRLIGEAKG